MKNRKGIIQANKTFIQNIDNIDDFAESLFSNFYPTKIDNNGMRRVYCGRSPLFRELGDDEEIPTYKFCFKYGDNSKIVFDSFEEVKLHGIDLNVLQQLESKIVALSDENQNLKSQLEKESKSHELETNLLEKDLKNWKERCKIFERMADTHYGIYELDAIEKSILDYNKLRKDDDETISKLERFKHSQETIRKKTSIFESWFK